jgi:putative tryptophan/tyrosine transport system substrate-binding protein
MFGMRRREFVMLLGGAAVAWPIATRAQQPSGKISRIGILASRGTVNVSLGYPAFIDELRRLGFTEGRNLVVEYHPTDEGRDVAFAAAAEMVRSNVEVIVAAGAEFNLQAALAASPTIPIVITANSYDPIARGYVASLARPGGNITGLFQRQPDLARKRVEIMREAFPEKTQLTVLWDAITSEQFESAERTAKSLNLQPHSVKLENPPYDFEAAFRAMASADAQMLLVLSSYRFSSSRSRLAELAIKQRLPTMVSSKAYAEAGGLMSYGVDVIPIYRRAASFVAKILRGAKPADLPVEQPNYFKMVINLKTAKALGITLPTSTLLRADEVIE